MIPRFKILTAFVIIIFFFFVMGPALAAVEPDSRVDLTRAFSSAFSHPDAFRKTNLFEVLGYLPDQVKQMVEVTPRPATLSVDVFPSRNDGKCVFDLIKVQAWNVKYYNLTIDRVVFDFPNVELDPDALSKGFLVFRKVSLVDIETNVSEADIIRVFTLFAKSRNLSDLHLKISPRETVLNGKSRNGIFLVGFKVSGEPKLDGEKKIRFNCRKLVLNGMPLPRNAINMIFNRINPVFDAGKTWLNLSLRKISAEKGMVRSWGTINPQRPIAGKGKG